MSLPLSPLDRLIFVLPNTLTAAIAVLLLSQLVVVVPLSHTLSRIEFADAFLAVETSGLVVCKASDNIAI